MSTQLDISLDRSFSLLFNYFPLSRMRNPRKMTDWAMCSTLSDYARGMKDVTLRSMSYFGTHVSSSCVRKYISDLRMQIRAERCVIL